MDRFLRDCRSESGLINPIHRLSYGFILRLERNVDQIIHISRRRDINTTLLFSLLVDDKKKMKSNTEDEYKKALASDDPTNISKEVQEKMAREAIKKFKSL